MKVKTNIFGVFQPQREPHEGDLLVVEPFLSEEYFKRSVVLLIEHTTTRGTVGLILNKSAHVVLNNVLPGVKCAHEIPLYVGGPVETDKLIYIHTLGDETIAEAHPLENGLRVGGNFDDVMRYINSDAYDENRIKFFAGYCGWNAGQLDSEIEERTWAVTELSDIPQAMSACSNRYWTQIVKRLGTDYRAWLNCPSDPFCN